MLHHYVLHCSFSYTCEFMDSILFLQIYCQVQTASFHYLVSLSLIQRILHHLVILRSSDHRQAIFLCQFYSFCRRSLFACHKRNSCPDYLRDHIDWETSGRKDCTFMKIIIMHKCIANRFVQCIVPSDILAGINNLSLICKKTAMC